MQDDFKKSILRDPIWMLGDVVEDADICVSTLPGLDVW